VEEGERFAGMLEGRLDKNLGKIDELLLCLNCVSTGYIIVKMNKVNPIVSSEHVDGIKIHGFLAK
jgi:hypothetical protein